MPVTFHCDIEDVQNRMPPEAGGAAAPGAAAGADPAAALPAPATVGQYFTWLNQLFDRYPKTPFIWAHAGGLGRFVGPGEGLQHIENLREVLLNRPNVNIDLSWDVVAKYFLPYRLNPDGTPQRPVGEDGAPQLDVVILAQEKRDLRDALAALINDFPDRFLYGSDALVPRSAKALLSTYGPLFNQGMGEGTGGYHGLLDLVRPEHLDGILSGNHARIFDQARANVERFTRDVLPGRLDAIQAEIEEKVGVPNHWPQDHGPGGGGPGGGGSSGGAGAAGGVHPVPLGARRALVPPALSAFGSSGQPPHELCPAPAAPAGTGRQSRAASLGGRVDKSNTLLAQPPTRSSSSPIPPGTPGRGTTAPPSPQRRVSGAGGPPH